MRNAEQALVDYFACEFVALEFVDILGITSQTELEFAIDCHQDFERLLAADEAVAEWRKAYPPALREAVEEKRPMTWVSGLPGVWGAHNTPVRELWV